MKTKHYEKSCVLAILIDAFADETPPAEDQIIGCNIIPGGEFDSIWKIFRGKRWQDLSAADLTRHRNVSGFTTEAYRYYLPAFMRLIIENPDAADILADEIVYRLTPRKDAKEHLWFIDVFGKLSKKQRFAVKSFLSYLCKFRLYEYTPHLDPCEIVMQHWME